MILGKSSFFKVEIFCSLIILSQSQNVLKGTVTNIVRKLSVDGREKNDTHHNYHIIFEQIISICRVLWSFPFPTMTVEFLTYK